VPLADFSERRIVEVYYFERGYLGWPLSSIEEVLL